MALEPITRAEQIMSGESLEPITREEMFLAKAAGMDVDTPEPITRREMFLSMIQPGDGSGATIRNQNKTITENGQYKADSGYTGLGTVTVAVPETEPVLQDKELTENGTYTADEGFDGLGEVVVNVPGNTAPVVEPLTVTENGTYTAPSGVDGYNPVTVNVAGNGDVLANGIVYTNSSNGYPAGTLYIYGTVGTGIVLDGQYIKSIDCKNAKRLFGRIMLSADRAYAVLFPPDFTNANERSLYNFGAGSEITFTSKPTRMDSNAFQTSKSITINVPWAEGEVANAPWGATNATINYNYTGG